MDFPEKGLQRYSGTTPVFSMRAELLVSSQSRRSVDADAWCESTPKRQLALGYVSIYCASV